MAVVWRLRNGAYILAEVNRTVSCLKFVAFHLIPYRPHSQKYLEITKFVDQRDLEGVETEEEGEVVEDNCVRVANSKAGIKPTAPLSAFDKENSIEFSLDFLHYLYKWLTLTLY